MTMKIDGMHNRIASPRPFEKLIGLIEARQLLLLPLLLLSVTLNSFRSVYAHWQTTGLPGLCFSLPFVN